MESVNMLICPFCGFKDQHEYQMLLHVEIQHSEDEDSPFAVTDAIEAEQSIIREVTADSEMTNAPASQPEYVDCPYKCGERVLANELQFHNDFHLAEEMALEEAGFQADDKPSLSTSVESEPDEIVSNLLDKPIHTLQNIDDESTSQISYPDQLRDLQRSTSSLNELFHTTHRQKIPQLKDRPERTTKIKRLGTTELGPYAHERRMPSWLRRMLEEGGRVTTYNRIGPDGSLMRTESVVNETLNLVNVLARLSLLDRQVARAFYCSPDVRHVAKMKDEGGFCGYRNIQMLISHIRDARGTGHQHFSRRLPSVIKLQDMIEKAWDLGYNANGRAETGGIWLTRKYIGTSEAQALLQSLDIPCEVASFFSTSDSEAYLCLLPALFSYFDDRRDRSHKVVITDKSPIYFQHRGHSMTIVGAEVQLDGTANLVVFDPMFNPSSGIKRLVNRSRFQCSDPAALLRAHRRGETYLKRYEAFEILNLVEPAASS